MRVASGVAVGGLGSGCSCWDADWNTRRSASKTGDGHLLNFGCSPRWATAV